MATVAGRARSSTRRDRTTVVALFCAAAVFRLTACSTEPAPNPDDGFDRGQVLLDAAEYVFVPTYEQFHTDAVALEAAVADYAAALSGAADVAPALEAARSAWRTAMASWQRAEVMQLGPAGPESRFTAGEGRRDGVYSWPSVSTCRVDQNVASRGWEAEGFFGSDQINAFGLDALEYLLFNEDEGNTCAPQLSLNAEGTWVSIADELDQRRADYGAAVAADLVDQTDELILSWTGTFSADLASAGEDASSFLDYSQAMDELFKSLFYLEITLKDRKLATPLGLRDCSADVCPWAFESPYADAALDNARANLEGGLALYRGGYDDEGVGMDDLLVETDYPEVDEAIEAAFAQAFVIFDSVDGKPSELIDTDLEALTEIYSGVKAVTDLLKGDMATSILLEIPQEAANDND